MILSNALIETIYEAAALPEYWSGMLEKTSAQVGAVGANIIINSSSGISLTSTPSIRAISIEFDAAGWNRQNSRVERRLERANHPGFLTDADLHSPHELATLPIYRDFLNPRGFGAGAGTVISGADNEAIVLAFEGFADHSAAHQSVPLLDELRPHFARAAILSHRAQQARTKNLIEAFNISQTAVGILDRRGKLLAVSDAFKPFMDVMFVDAPTRMYLIDKKADCRLTQLLAAPDLSHGGASIALRDDQDFGIAALHLIPARRQAQDVFSQIAYFALLSRPESKMLPSSDLLSALFDLTPAEARIARAIAAGQSTQDLGRDLKVTPETVKSHLKRAYVKTSTRGQSDLALLITGFRR